MRGEVSRNFAGRRDILAWGALSAVTIAFLFGALNARAETLEDSIRKSLQFPQIREAAADRRAIEYELRRARSLYYPQIDLRGAIGPEYTQNPTIRGIDHNDAPDLLASPGQSSSRDVLFGRKEISATLSQLIFDGWGADSEVERQKARVLAAGARVGERAEVTALDTTEAYLNILRNQELLKIAQENVAAHEDTERDAAARVRGGQAGVSELRQAEARLFNARNAVEEVQRNLADAEAAYTRLVGASPGTLVRPILPKGTVPANANDGVVETLHNNPAIKIAERDIQTAQAELRATDAAFWPRLTLEGTASRGNNIGGIEGEVTNFSALVVARWNLYRGGADVARRNEAMERLNEARDRLERFQRQAVDDLRVSWNAATRAAAQAKILRDRAATQERVVQAYKQEFDVGRRLLLDVLDAQNELFLTRSGLVTAEITSLFGGYRILSVQGKLLESLGIERPREAAVETTRTTPAKAMN